MAETERGESRKNRRLLSSQITRLFSIHRIWFRVLLNGTVVFLILWWSPRRPAQLITALDGQLFVAVMALWGLGEWVMLWRLAGAPPPEGPSVPKGAHWVDRGIMVGVVLAFTVSLRGWEVVPLGWLARVVLVGMGVLGISLRVWAIRTLGARFSRRVIGIGEKLRKGPYQWLAHPGYVGLVMVFFSLVGLLRSVSGAWIIMLGIVPLLWMRGRWEMAPQD